MVYTSAFVFATVVLSSALGSMGAPIRFTPRDVAPAPEQPSLGRRFPQPFAADSPELVARYQDKATDANINRRFPRRVYYERYARGEENVVKLRSPEPAPAPAPAVNTPPTEPAARSLQDDAADQLKARNDRRLSRRRPSTETEHFKRTLTREGVRRRSPSEPPRPELAARSLGQKNTREPSPEPVPAPQSAPPASHAVEARAEPPVANAVEARSEAPAAAAEQPVKRDLTTATLVTPPMKRAAEPNSTPIIQKRESRAFIPPMKRSVSIDTSLKVEARESPASIPPVKRAAVPDSSNLEAREPDHSGHDTPGKTVIIINANQDNSYSDSSKNSAIASSKNTQTGCGCSQPSNGEQPPCNGQQPPSDGSSGTPTGTTPTSTPTGTTPPDGGSTATTTTTSATSTPTDKPPSGGHDGDSSKTATGTSTAANSSPTDQPCDCKGKGGKDGKDGHDGHKNPKEGGKGNDGTTTTTTTTTPATTTEAAGAPQRRGASGFRRVMVARSLSRRPKTGNPIQFNR